MKEQNEAINIIPELPITLSIVVSQRNGKPVIELRKTITDFITIKKILSCAYHEVPINSMPMFSNKIKSISSMIDKGIVYRNEDDNNLYFTF